MEWVANEKPSTWRTSVTEFTKIHGNTRSYALNGTKGNAQIPVEQDADLVLKNLKLKNLSQYQDEVLLTTDRR